jgi:phospholipase D1/2
MFRPDANRLCKFLELSAMSTYLATAGGGHGKQGYLRIMSSGASRKQAHKFYAARGTRRHEPKWFVVRDSYLVAANNADEVEEPPPLAVLPIFNVDCTGQHMGCISV